jgi:hypothetical protein
MRRVELLIPPKVLLEIYETKNVFSGMTYSVPGGASLRVVGLEKRHYDTLPLVPVIVTAEPEGAINSLSSWLYDTLKHADVSQIHINGVEIEVTLEGITKTIAESIDSER